MAGKKGEVSVDLKLALAGFRKDLRAAMSELRKSLDFKVDVKAATAGVGKMADSFAAVARQAREARKSAADLASAAGSAGKAKVTFTEQPKSSYRIKNPFQSDADQFGSGVAQSASAAFRQTQINTERRMRLEELRAHRREGLRGYNAQDFFGNKGQFAPPYSGPTPPVVPPPVVGAQPQRQSLFQRMTNPAAGGGPLSSPLAVAAQVGSVLSGIRAALGIFKFALEAATVPLRAVAAVFKQAAEAGRQSYVNALRSGGGSAYSATRETLAKTLGVGEEEVYAYGAALGYLNERVRYSSSVTAATSRSLAEASVAWRAAMNDVESLGKVFSSQLSPVIRDFADQLRGVVPLLGVAVQLLGQDLARQLRTLKFAMDAAVGGLSYAFQRMAADASKPGLGAPATSVDRMQSSPWERMGLVLGGSGAADYARQTAANTRRLVAIFERQEKAAERGSLYAVRDRKHPRSNSP